MNKWLAQLNKSRHGGHVNQCTHYISGSRQAMVRPGETAELWEDEREAARLFKLAAQQGDATGQNNLGFFYYEGRGGLPTNDREAARLFKLAADQGHAWAQANLGLFYESGLGGLPKDECEAARLYQLAADQGHTRPQGGLGLCRGHQRRQEEAACARAPKAAGGGYCARAHVFERTVELAPDYAPAWARLGTARLKSDTSDAFGAFKTALDCEPTTRKRCGGSSKSSKIVRKTIPPRQIPNYSYLFSLVSNKRADCHLATSTRSAFFITTTSAIMMRSTIGNA
jgi:TPR repeat protein